MDEPKRIFSIDISNGFEIVSQYMQRSFTEAQQAAIWHIIQHAGQDPVPPAQRNPEPILHTVEMAKLVAETNARGLAAKPLGGRDHPPALSSGEAFIPLPDGRSIPVQLETLDTKSKRQMAREQGFTGDTCTRCGGSSMKRNGACLCCADCGETTGCS